MRQYTYIYKQVYFYVYVQVCTVCTHCMFVYHLSGSAPITNGKARVTVNKLDCNTTYTIIAGGILKGRLLGPRSLGPRLSHETINTSLCEELVATKKDDDRGI